MGTKHGGIAAVGLRSISNKKILDDCIQSGIIIFINDTILVHTWGIDCGWQKG